MFVVGVMPPLLDASISLACRRMLLGGPCEHAGRLSTLPRIICATRRAGSEVAGTREEKHAICAADGCEFWRAARAVLACTFQETILSATDVSAKKKPWPATMYGYDERRTQQERGRRPPPLEPNVPMPSRSYLFVWDDFSAVVFLCRRRQAGRFNDSSA